MSIIFIYLMIGGLIVYFGKAYFKSVGRLVFFLAFWPIFLSIGIYLVLKNE